MSLGKLIRARRKQLALTLEEVSKRSNLSVPFLSQVERDLAAPSMSSMVSIAKALNVSVSYFVDTPSDHTNIRTAAEIRYFRLDGLPVTYGRLTGAVENRKLDALLVCIPPGYVSESVQHAGEEFFFVSEGTLKIRIDVKEYVLCPGDSAHFNSGLQHRWENVGDKEVRLVWVGTPPLL
jgi:transcriptional regulator with XRE-family HTH domain